MVVERACSICFFSYIVRRLMEMLTNHWTLSSELRVPAISRLQKIHNVSVVFNELSKRGVSVYGSRGKAFYALLSKCLVLSHHCLIQ